MLINTVVVWASLRKLKNTSYDQHIEDFPTHLQNSIRLMKIWKSLGTLGWSPTTGSDNDTCSFSRGEAGASVVEVLAVAGISSTYWMMELKDTEQFSTHSPLYRYQKRSSSILDDKLNSLQSYNKREELHTLVEDIYWLFRVPCQSNHQKTGKKHMVSHGVSMEMLWLIRCLHHDITVAQFYCLGFPFWAYEK